jgi:hypothetical protein
MSLRRFILIFIFTFSFCNLLREDTILIADSKFEIQLPYPFIFGESIFVFLGDSLLPRNSFSFSDTPKPHLLFSSPLPESVRIKVVYYRFPLSQIPRESFRYQPSQAREKETLPSKEVVPPYTYPLLSEELSFSGSKYLGFNYSNQGFSLDQATDLKLSGSAGDINLSLSLSDRSLPQEEKTLELKELEGISLTISRVPYQVVFGDLENLSSFGEFGGVKRKGQGISFSRKTEGEELLISYLRPRNKFGVVYLSGEDGKKGPYILTAEGKRVSVVVGSEEVFLNGERKKRGEDEDYTIDYSRGELTFTNRVFINSLSRIEVRFLYYTTDYERSSFSFSHSHSGILSHSFSAFGEEDDRGYNFSFPLSDEEKRYLSTIGDDSTRAFLLSARYVGEGKGSYQKRDGVFVYCGQGKGDYEVSFSFVGEGKGDYIYDNEINGFRFVGEGQGNWTPKTFISLPQRRLFLSEVLSLRSYPFLLSLSGIGLNFDRNTFSPDDDADNLGFGYGVKAGVSGKRFSLSAKREGYFKNFLFPEGEENFLYLWGEKKEGVRGITELECGIFNAKCGISLLEKEIIIPRYFFKTSLLFLNFNWERAKRISRTQLSLTPKISLFEPSFSFRSEKNETLKTLEYVPNIQVSLGKNLISLGWEGIYKCGIPERISRIKGSGNFPFPYLEIGLLLGQEKINGKEKMGNAENFANCRIKIREIPFLSGILEGELKRIGVEEKEVHYIKVEEGKGNYKKDPNTGDYFPHPDGDYIKILFPTGKITFSSAKSVRANFYFNPKEEASFTSHLTWQKRTDYEERGFTIYFTFPFLRSILIRGNKSYNLSFNENLSYEFKKRILDKNSLSLPLIVNRQPLSLTIAPGLEINRDLGFNSALSRNRLEKKLKLENTLSTSAIQEINLSYGEITGEGGFKIKKEEGTFLRSFSFRQIGVSLTFSLIHRASEEEERIPYDLTLSEPLGWSYGMGFEVNSHPAKNLNLSFQYHLQKEAQMTVDHILNLSMRVDF